jgi:hypothetical protein
VDGEVLNEKLQGAIACAGFVVIIYMTYIFGNLYAGNGMPDGPLFAGVLVIVGGIFGYKFAPGVIKNLKGAKP